MHARRRVALLAAANVAAVPPGPARDHDRRAPAGPGGPDAWFTDPRIAPHFQLPDNFLTGDRAAFGRGRIVRGEDVAWGEGQSEGDTRHATNCLPGIAGLDRSSRERGIWDDLEGFVLTDAASGRLCLFAGPVLDPADQIVVGAGGDGAPLRLRVPQALWKVVVAKVGERELAAYAFVLEQALSAAGPELSVSADCRLLMVPLSELERRAGLVFDPVLHDRDQFDRDRGIELAFRAGAERIVAAPAAEEPADDRTPNAGDDAAEADEVGGATEPELAEAPRPYPGSPHQGLP